MGMVRRVRGKFEVRNLEASKQIRNSKDEIRNEEEPRMHIRGFLYLFRPLSFVLRSSFVASNFVLRVSLLGVSFFEFAAVAHRFFISSAAQPFFRGIVSSQI